MPRGRARLPGNVLFKSAEWAGWALGGLEREIAQTRERLAALTVEANKLRGRAGRKVAGTASEVGSAMSRARRRGRMTTEGRRRISEMMKKRWAEAKKKNRNRL
jgi:hypothetical protein